MMWCDRSDASSSACARGITRHRDGVSWVAAEVSGGRRSALARSVRRSQACRRRRCRACGSIASRRMRVRNRSRQAPSTAMSVPAPHCTRRCQRRDWHSRSTSPRQGIEVPPPVMAPNQRPHVVGGVAASTADRQCRTRTTRTPAQYGERGIRTLTRDRSVRCDAFVDVGPTRAATTCSDERSPLAQFSGAERRAQRAPRGGLSPGCRPTHRGSTTDAARSTAVRCRPSRPTSHRIGWSSR